METGGDLNADQQPLPRGTSELSKSDNISSSTNNHRCVREQDRFMPIANVTRIMRKILPPHAKIRGEAKKTIQECVSEYIGFVTSEANDICQQEKRKMVTAEDIIDAMGELGFDDYVEPLTLYLDRYREVKGQKHGSDNRAANPAYPVGNGDCFPSPTTDASFPSPTIDASFKEDPPNDGPSKTTIVEYDKSKE